MILCLDAGNTRLKWGLLAPAGWRAQGACAYAAFAAARLPAPAQRILACNVAGPQVAAQIAGLAAAQGWPLEWFISRAAACGVVNGYADPARLGADRWAALLGVRAQHAGAALVVMAGTATTIDVLAADGRFRGGLILPGLDLMLAALTTHTAQLNAASGHYCPLPTNTADAMLGGAIDATLGAIERMACRLASADFVLFVSGGNAPRLLPHLRGQIGLSDRIQPVEHLVLDGLACWARSQAG